MTRILALLAALLLFVGCGSAGEDAPAGAAAVSAADERLEQIQAALDTWRDADDLAIAQRAAEEASNLVTGPGVEGYGDADGDGATQGKVEAGLLPGQEGEDSIGLPLAGCAGADLLGGSWDDAAARWLELADKINAWTPTNNQFPLLASHPMRVVGWARLTLATDDLAAAHEYAGHAQLHVSAARLAVDDCS